MTMHDEIPTLNECIAAAIQQEKAEAVAAVAAGAIFDETNPEVIDRLKDRIIEKSIPDLWDMIGKQTEIIGVLIEAVKDLQKRADEHVPAGPFRLK